MRFSGRPSYTMDSVLVLVQAMHSRVLRAGEVSLLDAVADSGNLQHMSVVGAAMEDQRMRLVEDIQKLQLLHEQQVLADSAQGANSDLKQGAEVKQEDSQQVITDTNHVGGGSHEAGNLQPKQEVEQSVSVSAVPAVVKTEENRVPCHDHALQQAQVATTKQQSEGAQEVGGFGLPTGLPSEVTQSVTPLLDTIEAAGNIIESACVQDTTQCLLPIVDIPQ